MICIWPIVHYKKLDWLIGNSKELLTKKSNVLYHRIIIPYSLTNRCSYSTIPLKFLMYGPPPSFRPYIVNKLDVHGVARCPWPRYFPIVEIKILKTSWSSSSSIIQNPPYKGFSQFFIRLHSPLCTCISAAPFTCVLHFVHAHICGLSTCLSSHACTSVPTFILTHLLAPLQLSTYLFFVLTLHSCMHIPPCE